MTVLQTVQYKLATMVHCLSFSHRVYDMLLLLTTVCLCLKFLVTNIYDLPDAVNCLFHVFTAACLEAVIFFCCWTNSLEFTA